MSHCKQLVKPDELSFALPLAKTKGVAIRETSDQLHPSSEKQQVAEDCGGWLKNRLVAFVKKCLAIDKGRVVAETRLH
ncbi:MAG: hypothetical protein EXS30_00665 [Pedosphaera sp.]|nr:hypothetical protein [Pedosphaera sp.]